MLDEESKAVQEVAKATNNAIEAGRAMGGFIAKYVAGPLEQAMGIWDDKLKYRRWENHEVPPFSVAEGFRVRS